MSSSCVPGFDQLTRWSGQACALWSRCTPEEKRQWVQNSFQANGQTANSASIATIIAQMDASCSVAPAGIASSETIDQFNDASGDNQPSDAVQVLTNANFDRALSTGINAIGNTTLGIVQSNNRTNYGYPNNNPVGGFGGLGGFPQGGSGIYGGFNSPYGRGIGTISWTPIIIGVVIVGGLGVLVMTMSNRRS